MNSTKDAEDRQMRQRLWEGFLKRLQELNRSDFSGTGEYCADLYPDIIVFSSDHTSFFEPQNTSAVEVLCEICGLEEADVGVRGRVRVHPCQSKKMIESLAAAGMKIVW